MHRTVVDFPEPEGPMITSFSPSFTSRLTFLSTWRSPKFLHTFSSLIILLLHSVFRAGTYVTEKGAFTDLVKTPSFYGLYLKQFCALCQAFISSNLLTLLLLSPAGYPPGYRCCSKHPRQTRIPHLAQYRCRGYCGRSGYNRH